MRNLIRYGIFLIATLSLMTSNVVALSGLLDENIKLENNSKEPTGINICIDLIQYTYKELRDHSDTIVIGAVI